jgi:Pentapeptide repeats (8 copies)
MERTGGVPFVPIHGRHRTNVIAWPSDEEVRTALEQYLDSLPDDIIEPRPLFGCPLFDFTGAGLSGRGRDDLRRADLLGADLRRASLTAADPRTRLDGARMAGATVEEARRVTAIAP